MFEEIISWNDAAVGVAARRRRERCVALSRPAVRFPVRDSWKTNETYLSALKHTPTELRL